MVLVRPSLPHSMLVALLTVMCERNNFGYINVVTSLFWRAHMPYQPKKSVSLPFRQLLITFNLLEEVQEGLKRKMALSLCPRGLTNRRAPELKSSHMLDCN